jgi:hypothetical protein
MPGSSGTPDAGVRWPGERRSGFVVQPSEPHCGGCAHGRFRNLKYNAANTRTIPTFTISRAQKWCLKNRMSTPTTTATSASTYSTTAACLPTASFYYVRRSGARSANRQDAVASGVSAETSVHAAGSADRGNGCRRCSGRAGNDHRSCRVLGGSGGQAEDLAAVEAVACP